MNNGILVSVKNDGDDYLFLVMTTTDNTQARRDAYSFVYGGEELSQETVDDYTSIPKIRTLTNDNLIK